MSRQYEKSEDVPNTVLADRLDELVNAITKYTQEIPNEFYMRIPAEVDHDADLVFSECARRLRDIGESS